MTELPVIEPPPGGVARLRARIADDDRRRTRSRWIPLVTVVAAVIIALLVRPQPHTTEPIAASPSTLLPDPAVGVAFYWVAPTTNAPMQRFVDISTVSIAP